MQDDYLVRYGGDNWIKRTDHDRKCIAEKEYNKIQLDTKTTWKELLYEPLEEEDAQYIIKMDSVKVIDLGVARVAIPEKRE